MFTFSERTGYRGMQIHHKLYITLNSPEKRFINVGLRSQKTIFMQNGKILQIKKSLHKNSTALWIVQSCIKKKKKKSWISIQRTHNAYYSTLLHKNHSSSNRYQLMDLNSFKTLPLSWLVNLFLNLWLGYIERFSDLV